MEDIFVAIMCVFALGVGVWTWWYENHGPSEIKKQNKEDECAEDANSK